MSGVVKREDRWDRETDLKPIGALFSKGGGRWTRLYGLPNGKMSLQPKGEWGHDPLTVIERCADVVGREVSAGHLGDAALLGFGPAGREAQTFRPAARGIVELLNVLMRCKPKGSQAWIAELLEDVSGPGSVEDDLTKISGKSGRSLMDVLHQRLGPGRAVSFESSEGKRATHSAAYYVQAEAVKRVRTALEQKPLVRLQTALAEAANLGGAYRNHSDEERIIVLYDRLTKRGIAKSQHTAEQVFVLSRVITDEPQDLFKQITDRVSSNLAEPTNVQKIATDAGISVERLRSVFQAACGTHPIEWLQRTRIEAAKEYLMSTRIPIGEIGARCGMPIRPTFKNNFKKRTGLLPKDYRKTYRRTSNMRVADVLRWAEARLPEPIRGEDMAAKAGYSLKTFRHELKRDTGQTPSEWLNEKRIHLAREMLKRSSKPVKEIAVSSGFQSMTTFLRQFREHVGTTPLEYRGLAPLGNSRP